MIECRTCREILRSPPEKLGARCPICRMPLFERSDRSRAHGGEAGVFCGTHPESAALGRCGRCGQRVCAVCRSRWYNEALCPACADRALLAGETSPRELARRDQMAVWSCALAVVGWVLLLLTLIPWLQLQSGSGAGGAAGTAKILFFTSLLPAALALGQAAMALRVRVRRLGLATSGLILGALQVGLMIGVLLINRWHN